VILSDMENRERVREATPDDRHGFADAAAAGLNPAGIPTVTMTLGKKGLPERGG
jgi:hypothetical protein